MSNDRYTIRLPGWTQPVDATLHCRIQAGEALSTLDSFRYYRDTEHTVAVTCDRLVFQCNGKFIVIPDRPHYRNYWKQL